MFEPEELRNKLNDYQKEITHYSQMQTYSRSSYEQNYYQSLIQNETDNLAVDLEEIFVRITALQKDEVKEDGEVQLKVFTLADLSGFDGSQGQPAYVAVNGKVYDVSDKAAWVGGSHFAGLKAGNDLSEQFASCHRGMQSILTSLPVVGTIAEEGQ